MANLNTRESIVDYLKSQGKDSSYSARKKLAQSMGITNYTGTSEQNIQMLNAMQKNSSASASAKASAASSSAPKATSAATPSGDDWYAQNLKDYQEKYVKKDTPKIEGVDTSLTETANSTFNPSSAVAEADKKKAEALGTLEGLTGKENIVDQAYWDVLNSQFVVPEAVTEADAWLKSQLAQIQSGKTSYSDQVREMISKIQNRDKFSYDVDSDQLFQQALASAMGSGKQAMQDTIGQASALTGGYGSTYATSAGNQAYNAFVEDAYNNLPQYYQMAFEAYQAEGQDMYQQLAMLSDADAKEFERMLAAYDSTYAHRNQMYDEAYSSFRDAKSDAIAGANLQLSEHGQRVSDAYNYYNASADNAETLYTREWDKWQNEVGMALEMMGMQNSDYWKREDLAETQRQHNEEMTYKNNSLEYQKERDLVEDGRYIAENDFNGDGKVDANDSKAAAEWEANFKAQYGDGDDTDGNKPYSLSDTEIGNIQEIFSENGGGETGWDAVINYLTQKGKAPSNDEESEIVHSVISGVDTTITTSGEYDIFDPKYWETATFEKVKDTMNGPLGLGGLVGHVDTNDLFKVGGQVYTTDQIEAKMKHAGVPEQTRNAILRKLSKLDEDETYTFNGTKTEK